MTMDEFLTRIGFKTEMVTEVDVPPDQFVANLRMNVDKGDLDFFSRMFEALESGQNEYKGKVAHDSFEISQRRRLFDMNFNMAVATGRVESHDSNTRIKTEINGFAGYWIFFILIALIVYVFGFIIVLSSARKPNDFLAIPFLLIHASLMIGIPFLVIRRSVKAMKYNLEREFHYIAKSERKRS